MSQSISIVMPVYDGVTQLDFTGPHQFLSRTPDLDVRCGFGAVNQSRPTALHSLTWNLDAIEVVRRASGARWRCVSTPSRTISSSKKSPGLERPRAI
jgi:hypothetical protein